MTPPDTQSPGLADTADGLSCRLTAGDVARFGVEAGWKFGLSFRTRWDEQDAFGHVNHKTHLTWCEEARNAYLTAAGHPILDADHPGPVLREVRCSYEKPLGLAETILVTARTDWIANTSFGMSYAIWRDGLAARCDAVCIWYDNAAGIRLPVPDSLRAYMNALDAPEDRRVRS